MKFSPNKRKPSNSWRGKQRVSNRAVNHNNVISSSKQINGEFDTNADNKRRKRIHSQSENDIDKNVIQVEDQ
jgi:hypothetical protein